MLLVRCAQRYGDLSRPPPRRCHTDLMPQKPLISLATRNPAGVIEHALDRFGRESGTVVGEDDLATVGPHFNADFGCDPGLFGGIQRVIDQFLEDDERPVLHVMAGLGNQLSQAAGATAGSRVASGVRLDSRDPSIRTAGWTDSASMISDGMPDCRRRDCHRVTRAVTNFDPCRNAPTG